MEVKTTKQFYKEFQAKENIGYPIPTDEKKWIEVSDLIKVINKLTFTQKESACGEPHIHTKQLKKELGLE